MIIDREVFTPAAVAQGAHNREAATRNVTRPVASGRTCPGFTYMHVYGKVMHMRTTLIIDDALLSEAQQLSGLREKTAVVHAGLRALIAREQAHRLAALGGTERKLRPIPRRRTRPAR